MEYILFILMALVIYQFLWILRAVKRDTRKRVWHQNKNKWRSTKYQDTHEHILCCNAPAGHRGECISQPRVITFN